MKIVMLNASHRKDGATAKVLNEFASQLKGEGTEITMFHLADLELNFCKGCCACYKTGQCFLNDDAEMLSQTIAKADGVIIGTPCYVSGVSGQLKTFIDRGHFVMEQLLKGKHAIGVVTYENAGGGSAYNILKILFVFSGARTVDKLIIKTSFNSDLMESNKIKKMVEKKAAKLRSSIQRNALSLRCRVTNFFVLSFGIRPFVMKKGEAYKGVLKHWEERGVCHRTI